MTEFDKKEYWEKRIICRVDSYQLEISGWIKDIIAMADHLGLEDKKIKEAIAKISNNIEELKEAILEAEVKRNGK